MDKFIHALYELPDERQIWSSAFEVGATVDSGWGIGRVEWRHMTCRSINDRLWETGPTESFPYLEELQRV